jgi:hypothetical protein
LTVSVAALLAGCAALRATRRFVLKALGGIEFLLTGGEHELIAAVTASHGFVLIHDLPPSSSHGFGIQTWLEAGDWFKKRHDKPNPASSMLQPHLVHSSDKWKEIWHSEPYELSLKFLYVRLNNYIIINFEVQIPLMFKQRLLWVELL